MLRVSFLYCAAAAASSFRFDKDEISLLTHSQIFAFIHADKCRESSVIATAHVIKLAFMRNLHLFCSLVPCMHHHNQLHPTYFQWYLLHIFISKRLAYMCIATAEEINGGWCANKTKHRRFCFPLHFSLFAVKRSALELPMIHTFRVHHCVLHPCASVRRA
jgi:hypothetical protein